jgi:TolA-binding protein
MYRRAFLFAFTVVLSMFAGCRLDTGEVYFAPPRTETAMITPSVMDLSNVSEADLVEDIALNRQEYRQGLSILKDYYARTGNSRKYEWASRELKAMDSMVQYNYLGDVIPGPELKARMAIAAADSLFLEANRIQRDAGPLPWSWKVEIPYIKDPDQLRLALDKYRQLIKNYPQSDKIDDAAFWCGTIHEHFKDYSIALTYFQRAYQWDSSTPHPARFKAAYILDKKLGQKEEALDLYQEALNVEGTRFLEWSDFAEKRIQELTGVATP